MSAYTTLDFTREEALTFIASRWSALSNKTIEMVLDELLKNALYNANLVASKE